MATSMTLDVLEGKSFHFPLRIDVGHRRNLGTEDDLCVIREEVQLKKSVLITEKQWFLS